MQLNSISIPMNKLLFNTKQNTRRTKREDRSNMSPDQLQNPTDQISETLNLLAQKQYVEEDSEFIGDRNLFVLKGNSNLFNEEFEFSYIEISQFIKKLIPPKIENSFQARRMNLYEKFHLAQPPEGLQKQNLSEFLLEVSQKMGFQAKSLYLLNGKKINQLIQIPITARVVIASDSREFQEVMGLELLERSLHKETQRGHVRFQKAGSDHKNKVESWLKTACIGWVRTNKADKSSSNAFTQKRHSQDEAQPFQVLEQIQQKHQEVCQQNRKLFENLAHKNMRESEESLQQKQLSPGIKECWKLWNSYELDQGLEEEVVKIILKKVAQMREEPLVDALQYLSSPQDNSKLKQYELVKRIAQTPLQDNRGNQSRVQQKRSFNDTLNNFKSPFFEHSEYKSNKATFRVKKGTGYLASAGDHLNQSMYSKKSSRRMQNKVDLPALSQQEYMLKNEEIKDLCDRHRLTRKEVYDIRSQFVSMCLLSDSEQTSGDYVAQDNLFTHQTISSKLAQSSKDIGININYFIKRCSFLSGCLPHINQRILVAIGLDIENPSMKVNWPTFLELYCIFEAGRIEKESLIRFWIKFFDQKLIGFVQENEYLTLLEELIRGNSLRKANKTTKMFAKMFQRMMETNGVLGENNEIINDKLRDAFLQDRIDIQILCSALGRQKLDANLFNIRQE